MHQQTIQGVADRDTTGFGVVDDGTAHLQVTILVEVGVHHASACLYNGDASCITHKINEFTSAARDAEIHIAYSIQHLASSLVGGWQQGYNILVDTILFEHLVNQGYLFAVRAVGILTAFQHTGVAALETKGEDVERDVGTGLVYHADDAKGHRHTTETKAVGQRLLFGDMT